MISEKDEIEFIQNDLLAVYKNEIVDILAAEHDKHYSLNVDLGLLNRRNSYHDSRIVNDFKYLDLMNEALIECQKVLLNQYRGSVKHKVHVRISRVIANTLDTDRVPNTTQVGTLVVFRATVIRTGKVQLLETKWQFECLKCNLIFSVPYCRELYNQPIAPSKCTSCSNTRLKKLLNQGVISDSCIDYQEIRLQEHISGLEIGSIPQSVTAILENDLTDSCKAGDHVEVTAVVIRRWNGMLVGVRPNIEIALVANHIQILNQSNHVLLSLSQIEKFNEFWKNNPGFIGRDVLIDSFCPAICGMKMVKLAVLLLLIGGVAHRQGHSIRGDIHLLLVGDPGTAKSKFLRYAAQVSPRAILTTGTGTSTAGLTCTAVKDGNEWQLEAGALVLADKGICCIDEFATLSKNDKIAIHEAMEQQSISVAKAGIVCSLNTRCGILAACNPKGKFDESHDLEVNIALASPLISRFDLIMILLDSQNPEWDQKVAKYLVENEIQSGSFSLEELQQYIQYAKTIIPVLDPDANLVLSKYYQMQRASDVRNQARTTVRLLESLIRLAQAHARLMLHKKVHVSDALVAVQLVEASMQSSSLSSIRSPIHHEWTIQEYETQLSGILEKLGLDLADWNAENESVMSETQITRGLDSAPTQSNMESSTISQFINLGGSPNHPSSFSQIL